MKTTLKVKRLHPDAEIPKYATEGAACFDLRAVHINGYTLAEHETLKKAQVFRDLAEVEPGHTHTFNTGLAFEIPPGFVLKVYSRSGHGFKSSVRLVNGTGIIDADYRGELMVCLRNDGALPFRVCHGDRIAQAMLVPIPQVELIEVEELTETARGKGGFGSTGW